MLYRFTNSANVAIEIANELAVELGHNYVGTEHILYGLAKSENGIASQVLANQNILADTIEAAVERLKSGGRIGVITFHSLEDRIIKQTFAKLVKGCTCPPQLPVCVCGKKPILKKAGNMVPSAAEIEENPRSRSARLRYAIKI